MADLDPAEDYNDVDRDSSPIADQFSGFGRMIGHAVKAFADKANAPYAAALGQQPVAEPTPVAASQPIAPAETTQAPGPGIAPVEAPEANAPSLAPPPPKAEAPAAAPQPAMDDAAPEEKLNEKLQSNPVYQKAADQYVEDHAQQFAQEDMAFAHDRANGHITPQTMDSLYANKSTPAKIGTLFGLLLSGAGSGLAHQSNAVLDMMNKEISNDLEAQQHSKLNAQNMIRLESENQMRQAQTNNLTQDMKIKADAFARMRMNRDVFQRQADMVNNMSPNDPRYPQAQQTLAMMSQAVEGMNANIGAQAAAKLAMMNVLGNVGQPQGSQSGGEAQEETFKKQTNMLRAMGHKDIAEDRESKHVPGIGQATNPVSEKQRAEILGHQKLDAGLNDLLSFVKTHSTLVPGTPDYNVGQSKVRKLQAEIREGVLNTVYREGEQPLLDKFVSSNPAGIEKWWKTIPQLKTLTESNNRDFNLLKKNLGLPASKLSPSGSQPETKMYNGAQYQKVNGGWQKVK